MQFVVYRQRDLIEELGQSEGYISKRLARLGDEAPAKDVKDASGVPIGWTEERFREVVELLCQTDEAE